eukprot:TRINITY_DN1568_c0_g1_i1.p1 TRINITY_DN1568_c0_g1~~TRINITY_DN1568_c0_g1_i1.p1  ORF type:complete len:289 (-),score=79.04 TRINITY_DN1568_c0_g1_i1:207-1073(-)
MIKIFSLVLAATFVSVLVASLPLQPSLARKTPILYGHRGNSKDFPENTIPAFLSTLELAGIENTANEMDVYVTKDDVVVVFHDSTVDRTTNGTGNVGDFTLQELKSLDAGYKFTKDNGQTYPFRGKGIQIPTIAEVFAQVQGFINIDMKDHSEKCAKLLADEIYKARAQQRVIAGSFDADTTRYFQSYAPDVKNMASSDEVAQYTALYAAGRGNQHVPRSNRLQIPIGLTLDVAGYISTANSIGMSVDYWTIDTERQMRQLLSEGADGIITNEVALAAKVFGRTNRSV